MKPYLFIVFFICACASPVQEQPQETGMISHLVFFNLKPTADTAAFKDALRTLKAIPSVHKMNLGGFKDLKDKRALSNFEVAMEIVCKTEADYQAYQNHPIHLALKESVGVYLEAPPAVYDYTFDALAR